MYENKHTHRVGSQYDEHVPVVYISEKLYNSAVSYKLPNRHLQILIKYQCVPSTTKFEFEFIL